MTCPQDLHPWMVGPPAGMSELPSLSSVADIAPALMKRYANPDLVANKLGGTRTHSVCVPGKEHHSMVPLSSRSAG